jgi:cobalt-zinc-cadmium efflux system outer membrane protein
MSRRWLSWIVALGVLSGCSYAVQEQVDRMVCELPNHPLDVEHLSPPDQSTRQAGVPNSDVVNASLGGLKRVGYEEFSQDQSKQPRRDRFEYPAELPGAKAPPITIPGPDAPKEEREKAIDNIYPLLRPLGPEPEPLPGPNGRPLTLADLQNLARTNSPLLRQPAADVEGAWGAVLQAGAYPNPNFGYQADTIGTGATAGFQGLFVEQTFKTGGKLEVARASAMMSWENARLAFVKAQNDVATQVRQNYFAVLVAQENVKISRAMVRFTDEIYRIQVDILKTAGTAAAYEPMQLRVQSSQTRASLLLARNRYTAAWKQLAASLGLPGMKPTQLAGRVDQALPIYDYDKALAHVLSRHTDVLTAQTGIQKARYDLRSAQITPVPDISLHLAVEKDFSMPPFLTTTSVQLGGPIPIYDRNRGNIIQAQGTLMRAIEEPHRVRDDLTSRLASAFELYDDNRLQLEIYRNQIIPDQVRAYQGVYQRFRIQRQDDPTKVGFGDVVTAQQTLVTNITNYVTILGQAWSSAIGVADLLQTNDLFQVGLEPIPIQCVAPLPDLEGLSILPCEHPCTTMPDPALKGKTGDWPPAAPAEAEDRRPQKPR